MIYLSVSSLACRHRFRLPSNGVATWRFITIKRTGKFRKGVGRERGPKGVVREQFPRFREVVSAARTSHYAFRLHYESNIISINVMRTKTVYC